MGAIQKWRNTKTKSFRSQNLVSNLKGDDCDPKSNVRKSAERKLSMVESDIDISKIKSSASNTATKTSKSTTSHTATKAATTADSPLILDQESNDCDPKSNVQKSARRNLSIVESDIDVLKIKLSASNTSTKTSTSAASHTVTKTSKSTARHTATKVASMADSPFILDQKHNDCDPKSNVQKSAWRNLSMVESNIDVLKITLSASNTSTKTSTSAASHTVTKTSKSTASHTATKVATMADSPFILDQKHNYCDPKSNVQKSTWQNLSMVESDIDVLKIKLSASNTSTKTSTSAASHTATKCNSMPLVWRGLTIFLVKCT